MTRRVVVFGLVLVSACATEDPKQSTKRDDRWASSTSERDAEDRRRAAERERQERERQRQAEHDRAVRAELAKREEEWPEARPVVVLKGEPAPVRTETRHDHPPDHPPTPPREREVVVIVERQRSPEEERQARRDQEDAALAREFVRRLELLDKALMVTDRGYQSDAKSQARSWAGQRMAFVRNNPEEARRRGIYEPNEREIQQQYELALMRLRADWIRGDKARRELDQKMQGIGPR